VSDGFDTRDLPCFYHWLIARTGSEVVAREVFDRFKRYANHEANVPMNGLLERVRAASETYKKFITAASTLTGPVDRLGLFGYRTGSLRVR
jgi:hypothetical protein